jgi:hypothetical protein
MAITRRDPCEQLGWTIVRPRAATVLSRPRLVAAQVRRELDRAAERLGLPRISGP